MPKTVRAWRGGSLPARGAYDRARDLPALLPIWPAELSDVSAAARLRLLARLRRALRRERLRGVGGHWTYDLARHRRLLAAYRAEAASLIGERRGENNR